MKAKAKNGNLVTDKERKAKELAEKKSKDAQELADSIKYGEPHTQAGFYFSARYSDDEVMDWFESAGYPVPEYLLPKHLKSMSISNTNNQKKEITDKDKTRIEILDKEIEYIANKLKQTDQYLPENKKGRTVIPLKPSELSSRLYERDSKVFSLLKTEKIRKNCQKKHFGSCKKIIF